MRPFRFVLLFALVASSSAQAPVWTGSWAAAPVAAPASLATIGPDGTTFRDIVHLSIGGKAVRLRISNEGGTTDLKLAEVRVAVANGPASSAIQPATNHSVTFDGAAVVVIPAGTYAISDPIALPVKPFTDLAVSIFVPAQAGVTLTAHMLGMSTNFAVAGNSTAKPVLADATKINSWLLLKGVDVEAGPTASAVVVLGASTNDGFHSTADKNLRWPDDLARRLASNPATRNIGVLNEGISGNRILHDGTGPSSMARLDRDVLAQPGVRYLILMGGTNDIGRTFFPQAPGGAVTAEQIEWGYTQIALRAHARGIKVFGGTLNPFFGANYSSPDGEKMWEAVNQFVRTSRVFDGVIDFARATQDPSQLNRLLPAYDSGDHLHPNDAGYQAMADAVKLELFTEK